ncbi:hypothetical protein ACS15_2717 [Ralstonia insidiosa]|uniref:Uncharacterized protein n=1 Tax=Ralstonia insidiosa TaxID=190721 RepID=A0AAC9BJ77_9RALS|nr:hypothetical protein ACS15_2717 [Ralstonia insidiosa]
MAAIGQKAACVKAVTVPANEPQYALPKSNGRTSMGLHTYSFGPDQ